jgi:hypothetical protein
VPCPGSDERLLHGVLSFRLISSHGVELADQTVKRGGIETGELLTVH